MALKILRPRKKAAAKKKIASADEIARANAGIRKRIAYVMGLLGVLAFLVLSGQLYYWMIAEHDELQKMAIDNQTRSTSLTASRGKVYDRNMNILAASTSVETVFIDPNEIDNKMKEDPELLNKIAAGLSEILQVEQDFVREQAADTKYRYKVIKRKVSEQDAERVRMLISEQELSGVYLEMDAKRYYPYASLAGQLIGFVSSDNIGSEGIEAYYDDTLQGTAGKIVTTKGNSGSEMLYTYEKYYDAADGDSLVLTLDTTVQAFLEKNLANAIEKYEIQNGAFGIVMDVNNGEILGMATMGSYDPNNHLEVYDESLAQQLEEQYLRAMSLRQDSEQQKQALLDYNNSVAAARLKQWRNRCVSDGYEPGSTFKLVTVAAGLDCGAINLKNGYFCSGSADFKGRDQTLSCWKSEGHGQQDTAQSLGNSCNIALANMGLMIGGGRFYDYVDAFGFLEQTGVDLPGEASGYFFGRDQLTGPSTASLISGSFGQTFRITPMQLVRAVAAIVNGGYLLEPHIVEQVVDADGETLMQAERTVLRQVISEQTSQTMRELMEFVVTDGTAKGGRTPGYRVGGKTGTSEKIDTYDEDGKQVEDKIVSFVGVAPIDDPKYIVLVALDTPAYIPGTSYTPHNYYISGGLMAAPTVRDVFADILPYLGIEPDYTAEDIRGVNVQMPNVIGLTEAEAKEALEKRSLVYRTIGSGAVITDQIPAEGSELPATSEVILYFDVEKSTEMVEVPDFIGHHANDVHWLANNAGLYIQARGTDMTENYVTATYQDIEPGTMVDRGTTITVEFADRAAMD